MSEIISIREFARRKGVSDTAVHKHIKNGNIVQAITQLANGRPALFADVAETEWTNAAAGTHAESYQGSKRSNRVKVYDTPPQNARFVSDSTQRDQRPADAATLAAAKKAKAVYDAKLVELEYKRKAGDLLEKRKVYETLFSWGQVLRNELLALPDRVIDDVLAQPSRNESLTVLYDAIAAVLQRQTDFTNREIASER